MHDDSGATDLQRRLDQVVLSAALAVAGVLAGFGVLVSVDRGVDDARLTSRPAPPSAAPTSEPASTAPSAEPTPSEPSATTEPPAEASPSPTPRPRRPPKCKGAIRDCPDETPGWSNGLGGCAQATVWSASRAPDPALRIRLRLPSRSVTRGSASSPIVMVENTGKRAVSYRRHVSDRDDARIFDGQGRPVSAMYFSDVSSSVQVRLGPGETDTFPVTLHAYRCGDTSEDREPPLAAGRYSVSAALDWSVDGSRGLFVSDPVAIEITPRQG